MWLGICIATVLNDRGKWFCKSKLKFLYVIGSYWLSIACRHVDSVEGFVGYVPLKVCKALSKGIDNSYVSLPYSLYPL